MMKNIFAVSSPLALYSISSSDNASNTFLCTLAPSALNAFAISNPFSVSLNLFCEVIVILFLLSLPMT